MASICGSTAAQPIASSSRVPSVSGTSGDGGRSMTIATTTATIAATPRPMSVSMLFSSNGSVPTMIIFSAEPKRTATTRDHQRGHEEPLAEPVGADLLLGAVRGAGPRPR